MHLVTVVVGALILFAPMRPLLIALVPDPVVEAPRQTTVPRRRFGSAGAWLVVALLGVALGVFAFLGELSEGSGGQPIVRLLFVAAVFLSLAIAGLLIAFAFLGAPLDAALAEARPTRTPVRTPLLSTVATVVSVDAHSTRWSVTPDPASTDATKVNLAPTPTVFDAGAATRQIDGSALRSHSRSGSWLAETGANDASSPVRRARVAACTRSLP